MASTRRNVTLVLCLGLQIEELVLGFISKPEKDPSVRLDLSITNAFNIFQWVSTGDEKFSTSVFTPIHRPSEDPEATVATYINGFSNQFLRSTFIDLSDDVMNGLANASLVINVVGLNDKAPEAAPAKPVKGAPPVEAKPAEESLFKIALPLHALLTAKNSTINLFQPLSALAQQSLFNAPNAVSQHGNIADTHTSLTIRISADNDFAEYVLGCKVFQWLGASLASPPAVWGLHAPDVTDPKAKVPATEAELRSKYLDNINRLINDQASICTFELAIGVARDQTAPAVEGEEETAAASRVHAMFPCNALGKGRISFNQEAAAAIPANEDIRARGDLWSGKFRRTTVNAFNHLVSYAHFAALQQCPSGARQCCSCTERSRGSSRCSYCRTPPLPTCRSR
jgi:hypothetical protein